MSTTTIIHQRNIPADLVVQTKAAMKELGAFLAAVNQVLGDDMVQRAAEVWISGVETERCPVDAEAERFFRHITIRTLAQLAGTPMETRLEQK